MTLVADRPTTDNPTDTVRRTYIGKKGADGWPGVVRVLEESRTGSVNRPLRHRTGPRSHSPTGFSWGYGGSGPAETAHAILKDFFGQEPSSRLYQKFKFDVVAQWPQDQGWTLPDHAITTWLAGSGIHERDWIAERW